MSDYAADRPKAPIDHARRCLIATVVLNTLVSIALLVWALSMHFSTDLTFVKNTMSLGTDVAVRGVFTRLSVS